jgi:hypothetical protein
VLIWFAFSALLAQDVEFNRDVRPILSDRCFACHGPDAKSKNIALRLDVEADAKADLGAGRRGIVPGNPDQSEVVRRITADKPARRMPPAFTGHALTADQIDVVKRWIAQGAKWEKHWSLIAPKAKPLPVVQNTAWVRNPIDQFVLAKLEREGLQPSPEASPDTMRRRLAFDLTGLPPVGPMQEAYDKQVERLLASPQYGERMAIRWLDAARYADTNGYQFDGERVMWRWRDWVIDAFNQNKRYDQFVLEQVAGDMLPNATMDQKIATGFNRNHRGNTEDGIIPAEYAVEYVADRVETASTVFLGLTVGCARCHNHKYDPILQTDYYRMFAYFNNIPENGRAMKYGNSPPLVAAPTLEQQAQWKAITARIDAAQKRFEASAVPVQPGSAQVRWLPRTALDSKWEAGDPGEIEKAAPFDIHDSFTLAVRAQGEGPVLSKMVYQERGKGFGIYLRGGRVHFHITSNYADDAIRLDTVDTLTPGAPHHIAVTYDGSVSAAGVRIYVDGRLQQVKVGLDTLYRPFVNAGGVFKQPLRIGAGEAKGKKFEGSISEVRAWGRVLREEELAAIAGVESRPVFARNEVLETDPGPAGAAWREKEKLLYQRDLLERTFPSVMTMQENAQRRATHVLIRGAYDKPGAVVEPGVPASLPPLPAGVPNDRLGFAKWLIDPANPLTARVAVNRIWQMYFGAGLVKTVEDFGVQGDWPSHPELLDWLALEFVRSGWDMKAMHRLIVTSATYRQSSRVTPELLQKDPENRLLARGPRYRLNAEMVRDQALRLAGLLDEQKIGGPSVKPYQPDGLWKDQIMQDMYYVQGKGSDLYRRSLYTFWKRTVAPPMMVNFDAANREACVVRESRTNTPLQALNLMNDVTFLEAARFIGQRMMLEDGNDRLGWGFRLVTGRAAGAKEREVLESALRYHRDYFASGDSKRAEAFLKQGDSPREEKLDVREHASYAAVASLLLNLDEAVTKE